jgi:hypothetical protein
MLKKFPGCSSSDSVWISFPEDIFSRENTRQIKLRKKILRNNPGDEAGKELSGISPSEPDPP